MTEINLPSVVKLNDIEEFMNSLYLVAEAGHLDTDVLSAVSWCNSPIINRLEGNLLAIAMIEMAYGRSPSISSFCIGVNIGIRVAQAKLEKLELEKIEKL